MFATVLGHEGDWVELAHTPHDYISDFWYLYDVEIMAGFEKVLGHTDDAEMYARLAGNIRNAFNRTYFHPGHWCALMPTQGLQGANAKGAASFPQSAAQGPPRRRGHQSL